MNDMHADTSNHGRLTWFNEGVHYLQDRKVKIQLLVEIDEAFYVTPWRAYVLKMSLLRYMWEYSEILYRWGLMQKAAQICKTIANSYSIYLHSSFVSINKEKKGRIRDLYSRSIQLDEHLIEN